MFLTVQNAPINKLVKITHTSARNRSVRAIKFTVWREEDEPKKNNKLQNVCWDESDYTIETGIQETIFCCSLYGGDRSYVGCVYTYIHAVERSLKRNEWIRDMPIKCMLCCMLYGSDFLCVYAVLIHYSKYIRWLFGLVIYSNKGILFVNFDVIIPTLCWKFFLRRRRDN